MKQSLLALALAALIAGAAAAAFAQAPEPYPAPESPGAAPPPLPALTPEQASNLNDEMTRYRQWVDERVARGELVPDEARRLVEWRRWQLARQIAGLTRPEPRVIVQREYVYRPYAYGPYYAAPPYYYYGPRVSVCAGGFGRHSFGSVCF